MGKENLKYYEMFRQVPNNAQKTIKGGRINGYTDINPMWRIKALTEAFGVCGIGWKIEIAKQWIEPGANDELVCFVNVNLYIKVGDVWSEPIPGNGGNKFVTNESKGLYTDDDGLKKAISDAIGSACKLIGVGADIYWDKDATKYDHQDNASSSAKTEAATPDYVAKAVAEMNTCTTMESVTAVWNKHPKLVKNDDFINACKAVQIKVRAAK